MSGLSWVASTLAKTVRSSPSGSDTFRCIPGGAGSTANQISLATISGYTASAMSNAAPTLAIAGDSIDAGSNALATPAIANFSGSGTTGSITASLSVTPGNFIWISGLTQTEWNGRKTVASNNGSTITFTNATALTASPTATNGTTGFVSDESTLTNRSYFAVANGLCGLPFATIWNRAVSGTTSTTMLANFSNDILATNASYIWVKIGTNDINAATDANTAAAIATCMANITSACGLAQTAGKPVILSTIPPQAANSGGSTGSANAQGSAVHQAGVLRLNQLIKRFARATPGVYLFDMHAVVSNPTGLAYKSGWSIDGIHPTSKAAFAIGVALATLLNNIGLTRTAPLVDNSADCYASDSASLQLLGDPLIQASSTSAITGFSGQSGSGNPSYHADMVPSRYVGTPSASVWVAAASDGIGNSQYVNVTSSSNNDQLLLSMQNTGHLNPALLANAGKQAKLKLRLTATNIPSGTFNGFDFNILRTDFGVTLATATGTSSSPFFDVPSGSYTWTIESAPFIIQSGVAYGTNPNYFGTRIVFRFAGNAAGATFEVNRWSLDILN